MAAPLKREQRVECESRSWELRQRGWTIERIAAELGYGRATVWSALRRVEARVAAELAKEVRQLKARQTAQLDRIIDEAIQQWERSKEDAESETVVSGRVHTTKEGEALELPDQVTRVKSGQSGNPALLAQARGALADQRAIWGAEAPAKVAPTTPDGEAPWKSYMGVDTEKV